MDNENLKTNNNEFYETIINNLKNELVELNKKIVLHREREDYLTYKNLINSYSEILRLYERYTYSYNKS